MPPPDTSSILNPDSFIINFIKEKMDSLGKAPIETTTPKQMADNAPQDHWGGLLIFAAIFLLIIWVKEKSRGWFIAAQSNIYRGEVTDVVDNKGVQYHDWLMNCNPYYASLSNSLQQVFLARAVSFMQSKQFHFHSIDKEEYIPVLISAAAVQITFGLKNYLLDYFTDIHVMKKEYVLSIDNDTYYGHVSKSGIYISWSHFMHGYSNYSDSINVGLHEMAHALQYDAYLGYECSNDRNFKERLTDFSEEGRPIFRAMRAGVGLFFDEYATTNFDEFWAVSVENFFENPATFKKVLPELYTEICELLNQDPLLADKIINTDRV